MNITEKNCLILHLAHVGDRISQTIVFEAMGVKSIGGASFKVPIDVNTILKIEYQPPVHSYGLDYTETAAKHRRVKFYDAQGRLVCSLGLKDERLEICLLKAFKEGITKEIFKGICQQRKRGEKFPKLDSASFKFNRSLPAMIPSHEPDKS